MAAGGPYLAMAVLCEKVLQEKDSVLSLIRIVDRITHVESGPHPPEKMPPISIELYAVIAFKSGDAKGDYTVVLKLVTPSGHESEAVRHPITLKGGGHGYPLTASVTFQLTEEGLHWVDVLLDERLVTRIPLQIVYRRVMVGSSQAEASA